MWAGDIMSGNYADTRKKEMEDIFSKLEQGVREVYQSDNYKNYLSVMASFHRYSVNNSILIALQKPDATLVAGYNKWIERKRQVKKGEKSIRILAPQNYTVKEEKEVTKRDVNGNFIFENGKPVTEKKMVEEKRIRFVPVSVFDISQTTGEPLPTMPKVEELDGNVEEFEPIIRALKNVSSYPITFKNIGEDKGYCDNEKKEIVINEGMSDLQTIKTSIHEVAHNILHNPNEPVSHLTREEKEVQAESVAYVVASRLGLDTSEYSFGYIAAWGTKELSELKSSLSQIQKAAETIIDEVEKELEKFRTLEHSKQEQYNLPDETQERQRMLYNRTIDDLKELNLEYQKSNEHGKPIIDYDYKKRLEDISNKISLYTDFDGAKPTGELQKLQSSIDEIIKDMGLNGISAKQSVIDISEIYNKDKGIYNNAVKSLKFLNSRYNESISTLEPMTVEVYLGELEKVCVDIVKKLEGKNATGELKDLQEGLNTTIYDTIKNLSEGQYDGNIAKNVELLYKKAEPLSTSVKLPEKAPVSRAKMGIASRISAAKEKAALQNTERTRTVKEKGEVSI